MTGKTRVRNKHNCSREQKIHLVAGEALAAGPGWERSTEVSVGLGSLWVAESIGWSGEPVSGDRLQKLVLCGDAFMMYLFVCWFSSANPCCSCDSSNTAQSESYENPPCGSRLPYAGECLRRQRLWGLSVWKVVLQSHLHLTSGAGEANDHHVRSIVGVSSP